MSNETGLDWLARNVQVWPDGKEECLVVRSGNPYPIWSVCKSSCGWIMRSEWLARRAELQNKPSWSKAEEWAEWLAQDSYGCWGFFQKKPLMHALSWIARSGYCQIHSPGNSLLGDWRDTLEKRPEEFKPFTSIEDNQEKDMKQDNGWYERGDLPPVGIAVQLWHGGTYAYDCELIAKRGNDFVLWNLTWDRPDSADCMMCVFKPTPTEREILADLIESHSQMSALVVADAILATGFSLRDK